MNRRTFLKNATSLSLLAQYTPALQDSLASPGPPTHGRVRPGDAAWPAASDWDRLRQQVNGRLLKIDSPFLSCQTQPEAAGCAEVWQALKNPHAIGDHPALTQTTGWANAWTTSPSAYAVAAEETADLAAAVNFAREHRLRLVIKGGGHSYQGTSNAADSLLIWTRKMNKIQLHEAFSPEGNTGQMPPQPAVTVGAGAVWSEVYQAVTTRAGRYVQGGGCTTVGVAGLIQSGGFGNFSKQYGLAAAGLLEAEVVTADGGVRRANAFRHPDLFWALKGGGGGSFGVVTQLTLATRELPEFFGAVIGTIQAHGEGAFHRLVTRLVAFYQEALFTPNWGEQIRFLPGQRVQLSLVFQGLNRTQVEQLWQPFLQWLARSPGEYGWSETLWIAEIPARHFWDPMYLKKHHPQVIAFDDRAGAPESRWEWAGDQKEAGQFLNAYRSAWLPAALLDRSRQGTLVDALVGGSRHWGIALHFNKGLAGAPEAVRTAARDTAINPVALEAFALAIVASNGPAAIPGVPGREPDLANASRQAEAVRRAMGALLTVVKNPGSYLSESNYFEASWQQSFWGTNHPRLAAIKRRYDGDGLFFVHHGVGSEEWSPDGFTRRNPS